MNKLSFADALPPPNGAGLADTGLLEHEAPAPRFSRNAIIAASVIVFHMAALWALQTGLLRRAVEMVVPAEILSEIITPPAPKIEPEAKPDPVKRPVIRKAEPRLPPPPMPVATNDPTPAPNAPTGVVAPQPPAPPIAAPVAATPAPPAPPRLELPSSSADYLQNPKPAYPPVSKRLGEQGRVMVRVFISADGLVQQAEVSKSSGFLRLDDAALSTVKKWRFVPGKRAGVPEAMWFNVPVDFVLE